MGFQKTSLGFLFSASLLLLSLLQIWQWVSESVDLTKLLSALAQESSPLISAPYNCEHNYNIELISFDPLVIYANNFITEPEIQHLLESKKDDWEQSYVYNQKDNAFRSEIDTSWRTSKSAMVLRKDPVAKCLSQRMKSFLGNLQHIDLEPLQLVRYDGGEQFRLHQDWLDIPKNETFNAKHKIRPYNRFITGLAYLYDNCTGGETWFPHIKGVSLDADGEKFSRTESGEELLFKPRRGNAVFWNNLHMNGTGDFRALHAGLPVKSGTKIAMNLFSLWYLDSPIVGGVDESS
ncbi:hypothetical protein N431DRAFT_457343 [Stipitochalara longipes BDJ]|nr:hypothetical protein N431DRAFT_457343 [Stipitochalara longipes BDJ]